MRRRCRNFLICAGFNTGGDVRQEASNLRMVVLSIAPTLYIAEAEEWIASKASLLNLPLAVMANLHPISIPKQLVHLLSCQTSVCLHQPAEAGQLIVLNVCPILLCKQILIDPEVSGSCKNDG